MRVSISKGIAPFFAAGILVALALAPGVALADWFVGFDGNGDSDCEAADFDRGRFYSAAEVGMTDSVHIFFNGDAPGISVGCVFCVTEQALI